MIHNPLAGPARGARLGPVLSALEGKGCRVVITSALPEEILKNPGDIDAIIAVGGDGTIRRLAQLSPEFPIGVVPAGTGNVLVREIGCLTTPAEMADTLINGRVVELEGARANDAPFFLMAGVGFDADIVNKLSFSWKRRLGRAAYAFPTLRALRHPFAPFSVTVDDGEPREADWMVATKSRRYAGAFLIAPDAKLTDEGFRVFLMRAETKKDRMKQMWALYRGRLAEADGVTVLQGRKVTVTADDDVACQVDGDPLGTTPLVIEDGGPKFKLIVPDSFEASQK